MKKPSFGTTPTFPPPSWVALPPPVIRKLGGVANTSPANCGSTNRLWGKVVCTSSHVVYGSAAQPTGDSPVGQLGVFWKKMLQSTTMFPGGAWADAAPAIARTSKAARFAVRNQAFIKAPSTMRRSCIGQSHGDRGLAPSQIGEERFIFR